MLKPFNFNQLDDILKKHLSHLNDTLAIEPLIDVDNSNVNHDGLVDKAGLESIFQIEKSSGRSIFPKVLALFQQEMQVKLPELLDAYLQQDSKALYQTAHAIKSSAGNVGAKRISELCQIIEDAGLSNNFLMCSNELKVIQKTYEQTIEQLNEL